MAQVKQPLMSDAARGKVGELVFANQAGLSVVKKFVKATDTNSDLQRATRSEFGAAGRMFKAGWNNYSKLTALTDAQRSAYNTMLLNYAEIHTLPRKSWGGGFSSGNYTFRNFLIHHAMLSNVVVKIENGKVYVVSETGGNGTIFVYNAAGVKVAGSDGLGKDDWVDLPASGAVAIVVSSTTAAAPAATVAAEIAKTSIDNRSPIIIL